MAVVQHMKRACPHCGFLRTFRYWSDGSIRGHNHWICPKWPKWCPPSPPHEFGPGSRYETAKEEGDLTIAKVCPTSDLGKPEQDHLFEKDGAKREGDK